MKKGAGVSDFCEEEKSKSGEIVPAINARAVALLLSQKTQSHHSFAHVFIADNETVFREKLALLNDERAPRNISMTMGFVNKDGHLQMLKIERRNGLNNVAFLDSIGANGTYNKETLNILSEVLPGARVYYTNQVRQKDGFSCYAFCLADAEKMACNQEFCEMMKTYYALPDGSSRYGSLELVECIVPPQFMHGIQSHTAFNTYLVAYDTVMQERSTHEKFESHDLRYQRHPEASSSSAHVASSPEESKQLNSNAIYVDAEKHKQAVAQILEVTSHEHVVEAIQKHNARHLDIHRLKTIALYQEVERSQAASGLSLVG